MEYLDKRQKLYVGVKFRSFFGLETAVSLHACVVSVGFRYCAVKACVEYDGEV